MHIDMMIASIGITPNLYRLQQRDEVPVIRRISDEDPYTMYELLSGLPNERTRKMEMSVNPFVGANLDVFV